MQGGREGCQLMGLANPLPKKFWWLYWTPTTTHFLFPTSF